jgi:hypothetical protein
MTDTKQTQATQDNAKPKAPAFIAYQVRDGENEKSFWTRIGSAFAHKDGNGFTVQLDALPVDGRITLRRPEEKASSPAQSGGRKPRTAQPAPV